MTAIFSDFSVIEQVILYGSRAIGTNQKASDIDLTLKGPSISLADRNKIANRLDDLLLPYTIDLSIYNAIDNITLLDHINRVGQLIYKK